MVHYPAPHWLAACRCVAAASALTACISAWCADAKPEPAKSLVVKTVKLQGKDMPLSKVLQDVQTQSGIEVRRGISEDPKIELNLQNVPFWQALDEIAKTADLRVSLYHQSGKITLAHGPYQEVPTCYSGPFRIVLKKIITIRDLESGAHGCVANLEVAWQPPFQPFLMETKPSTFVLKDDKGLDQQLPELTKKTSDAGGDRLAASIDVALPALRRGVPRIGLFKGSLKMVGSAQLLTFTFNDLKKDKQEKEGVVVEIASVDAKVNAGENFWTVAVGLKYPASTFGFESFQIGDWLVRNKALLVSKRPNGPRYPENAGYETDDIAPNHTLLRYRWVDEPEKKILLEKTANWKFEYTTPGPVIEVPVDFEFKDVPLP